MLLKHVTSINSDAELQYEYNELVEQFNTIIDEFELLCERAPFGNVADMPTEPGQVEQGGDEEEAMLAMDQVIKQLEAAKRGMGLTNTLKDSPSRTKNRSRIMGNLNKIRANLGRITKMLGGIANDQMDAAKRGLGVTNKLSNSPDRTTNRSRIMGNMNKIRSKVKKFGGDLFK